MPDDLTDIIESQSKILHALEILRREDPDRPLTFAEKVADKTVTVLGSWSFILIQACILFVWMLLNSLAIVVHFDPYPFILLNLVLSFQAAFASPVILMAQKRQEQKDRRRAVDAYNTVVKIESMLKDLYEKLSAKKG